MKADAWEKQLLKYSDGSTAWDMLADMKSKDTEIETIRARLESESSANREHVQQARRLIAERDAANARLEKALDWLMAKHGGRLDAAESIDGPLYDILEGK